MSACQSGPFAVGDDLTRHDVGAEPRNRLTAARPRPRRDAYPVLHVPSDGVGPNEAARRYADQQAEEMASHGYFQAKALDVARIADDRSSLARLTALIADASRDTGGDPGGMARRLIAQGVRL